MQIKNDAALLIGVDLGTTGVRSIAYDTKLNEVGAQYYEYPLIKVGPDRIEQDANLWWELVCESIRAAATPFGPARSCALSLSTQGIAFVPVAPDGIPIGNAISWLDRRATEQITELLQAFDARSLYNVTGKRPNEVYILPKLMWLRMHEPDVFYNAHAFALAHDYITGRMTSRRVIDRTLASGTMLYNIHELNWSRPLLDACGVSIARLPALSSSGTPVSRMHKEVSAMLGLPADTIVVTGAQDQKCAALGAGITKEQATLSLGTAAALSILCDKPQLDDQMRVPCFAGIDEGTWITEGVISTAAAALKWLRETFFPTASYSELSALAERSSQDGPFFYPYLAGASSPEWYAESSGCFYGLSLNTRAEDIVYAVLEGVAFQIKSNLQVMNGEHSRVRSIRAFGGGANSDFWCQIISNATGLRVEVPRSVEMACLGAAQLAGLGNGTFQDFMALRDLCCIRRSYTPATAGIAHLDKRYENYRKVEQRQWGPTT